jgi:hypothetical protein
MIAPDPGAMPQKNLIKRTLNWLRGERQTLDVSLFDSFAWDSNGDALLAGDLSALSSAQRSAVEDLAQRILSAYHSFGSKGAALGDARIVALGVIAQRSKQRTATRFARRALRDAPEWAVSVT